MTSTLNAKISKCKSLLEALEVIADDEALAGALKVNAGGTRGAVAFAEGKLMGAFVNTEDGRGQTALDQLLALSEPTVRFAKFDYKQLSGAERIELEIRTLIAELKKPQLSLLEQLAFSDEDEEPKEDSSEERVATPPAAEPTEEPVAAAPAPPPKEPTEEQGPSTEDQPDAEAKDEPQAEPVGSDSQHDPASDQEKEAFFSADSDMEDEALTEAQRMLLEAFSTTEWDKAVFEQSDPKLKETDESMDLVKSQMELIVNTKFDSKPFETSDVPVEPDGLPSLSEEQKKALDMMAETTRDKAGFEEVNAALEIQGLELSTEDIRDLGETLLARSRDEQQEEFAAKDDRLQVQDSLPPVAEPQEPPPAPLPTTEELDAIKSPQVLAEDYHPLPLVSEMKKLPERQSSDGLLGRERDGVIGKVPGYEGERAERRRLPVGRMLGAATIVVICVALFTVPSMIRSSATGQTNDQLADEQLRQVVREETTVRARKPPPPNANAASYAGQGSTSGAIGGASIGTDSDQPPSAIQNDPLAFARALVMEGKVENAVPNYEAYIAKNPENIEVRIEYIRALIAIKRRDRAYQMCVAAIKHKLTDAELVTINSLMKQCAFAD